MRVIGNALVIFAVLTVLVLMLKSRHTAFSKKLKARRVKEQKAKRRRDLLEESVQTHLVPALIKQGFEPAPPEVHTGPVDREYVRSLPAWGRLRRVREPIVDQVEIQLSTYGRAAFRINACAVPKDGMMTAGGHKTAEECLELGVCDLETHARPWLRPGLRALGLEPLGAWFSVWHAPFRSPTPGEYEKLALRAVGLLVELELALREGKLGPHMRRREFRPLPAEVLERLNRLESEGTTKK